MVKQGVDSGDNTADMHTKPLPRIVLPNFGKNGRSCNLEWQNVRIANEGGHPLGMHQSACVNWEMRT